MFKKIKEKLKINGVVALIVGCILIGGAAYFGVRAYETDKEVMKNVISIGENKTEIVEEFNPVEELNVGGNTYIKRVIITNTGDTNAFVRVKMEFSDKAIAEMSGLSFDGNVYWSASKEGKPMGVSPVSGIEDDSYLLHLPEGWVYIPEDDTTSVRYKDEVFDRSSNRGTLLGGYLYYTKPLAPGEDTTKLLESVTTYFAKKNDVNSYEIIVYAESVQTKNHNGEQYADDEWELAWIEFMSRK